ncbi:urease accessory protein [Polaromonas sp.]|uniref:HoxN/HupN/NixA family nickel/cobalt transporter n=1 Tax=Polaromonas sp. TaxID=1869339 RepID=UPI00286CDFC7|nr:urease accessory protein [Polaromonas sp.]
MSLLFILLAGFLLGMKHATEADHLAAVATLASGRQPLAHTVRQGIAWGLGHSLTLMLFGGIVLALGKSVPAGMEQALELAVALMLIALGVDVLRRLVRQEIHFHAHQHAPDTLHVHAHSHARATAVQKIRHEAQAHEHRHSLPLRALAVGMMHGMAGSAALILLSLEAVQSFSMGLAYIALFGLGSIAGMALLSVAIALPLRLSATAQLAWLQRGLTMAVGVFSCLLGALMVYRTGLVQGLLM